VLTFDEWVVVLKSNDREYGDENENFGCCRRKENLFRRNRGFVIVELWCIAYYMCTTVKHQSLCCTIAIDIDEYRQLDAISCPGVNDEMGSVQLLNSLTHGHA
jgi:hypothetical protein